MSDLAAEIAEAAKQAMEAETDDVEETTSTNERKTSQLWLNPYIKLPVGKNDDGETVYREFPLPRGIACDDVKPASPDDVRRKDLKQERTIVGAIWEKIMQVGATLEPGKDHDVQLQFGMRLRRRLPTQEENDNLVEFDIGALKI